MSLFTVARKIGRLTITNLVRSILDLDGQPRCHRTFLLWGTCGACWICRTTLSQS